MEITVSNTPAGTPILAVKGEIDLHTCADLRATLQRLMDEEKRQIILNLADVPYVDSAALGVLVDTQRRLKEKGGEVHLVHVTAFVLRAFEITRLIRIFRTYRTLELAMAQAEGEGAAPA